MSTGFNVPAPAPFKPAWDNPEKTFVIFETWTRQMRHYFLLARRQNAVGAAVDFDDGEKMALALIMGGTELRTLFETVAGQVIEGGAAVTYDAAVTAANNSLKGRMNETSQVYALNKMEQGGQTFASWYPKVLEASQRINWEEYNAESAAKNVMIVNCDSEKLRMKAIAENLNYNNFIRTALAMENSENKAKDMGPDNVKAVKDNEERVRKLDDKVKKLMGKNKSEAVGGKRCATCGRRPHPSGQACFAAKLTCHTCNKMGHLQAVCKKKEEVKYVTSGESEEEENVKRVERKKKKKKSKKKKPQKRTSDTESDTEESVSRIEEKIGFRDNEIQGKVRRRRHVEDIRRISLKEGEGDTQAPVQANGKKINFTVDTGVRRNLMNWKDWKKIAGTTTPVHTGRRFVPYGTSKELPVRAKAKVTLKAERGATVETEVYVVESEEVETLLGKDDALRLGIVQLCPEGQERARHVQEQVQWLKLSQKVAMDEGEKFSDGRNQQQVDRDMERIVSQYPKLFQGLGEVKGQEVDILLKPTAKPKIQPRRPIPIHYTDKLKKKVAELKREGVIEGPLHGPLEPGSYVSNPVITAKRWSDQEIRLNLDLSDANEDIVTSVHPIPTPEELRHEFREADTFTSIDANQMFQQWRVAKNKRKIFTFRTPWGLYRYVRLPSGVNCAGAEANNNFRAIVEGLKGITQIQDDVVVFGKGRQHDRRLEKLLKRLEEWGITLRREKCQWGRQSVLWFGKIYSRQGVSIDPAKTEVIRSLPTPQNAKETRSFLQMAQFNAEFLHPRQDGKGKETNYAELTKPLRDAANAANAFNWTKECQESFERIKELMASDKLLEHFHPERPSKVYVDFSTEGVSATLAQGRHIEREDAQQLKRVGARVSKVEGQWVEWRPVTHVSRSLDKAERNYASVERGVPGRVVWGVEAEEIPGRHQIYSGGGPQTIAGPLQRQEK